MNAVRGLVFILAGVPCMAAAQSSQSRWQTEVRIDALSARGTAYHAGAGANATMGTYARLALLGGTGARRLRGRWASSGRVESVVRVHVDPLRQFRWGAYVGGGAALMFDDGARTRARAVVIVGYEGPATDSGWIAGIEAGIGGGLRVAVAARRARDTGR
jgi:hypothetical protein